MAEKITVRLVTPVAEILETEVDEVRAPSAWGGFGVRLGHTPFLCTMDAGPLILTNDGKTQTYVVIDGFVEVGDDQVTVLAEEAVLVSDIDAEAEERAMSEARKRMEGLEPDSDEHAHNAAVIRRSAARTLALRG